MLLLLALAGCAPTLHLTRPAPPEATLGSVRTLSVSVATNMGRAIESSIITGLAMGEIPVPVPVNEVVRRAFEGRLEQLGYGLCSPEPCGDGAMSIELVESSVNSRITQNGIEANVRLKGRVRVRQADGQEPYDWTFWDSRSGGVAVAPMLVQRCAEQLVARFDSTLQPRRATATLPLVDGGPLGPGVNMLLSSNWTGAISYFSELTRTQPDLDGAWYDLGVAWEAQGDWAQALGAYEQAAALKRSRTYLDAVEAARRYAPADVSPPQRLP